MYEVAPLFSGASIEQKDSYALPAEQSGKSLYLTSEEQTEVGFRVAENGDMIYFDMTNGRVIDKVENPLGQPTAFALESDTSRMMAFAYVPGAPDVVGRLERDCRESGVAQPLQQVQPRHSGADDHHVVLLTIPRIAHERRLKHTVAIACSADLRAYALR